MNEALLAAVVPPRPVLATWFRVHGNPAPKGSKSAFPIRRKDGSLGVAVREGKTNSFADWNAKVAERVAWVAGKSDGMMLPFEGPLGVELDFFLSKPKSAPKRRRTWPERKPDADKLARGVLDALSGALIRDDAQVIDLHVRKFYADDYFTTPGVEVRIQRLEVES